MKSIEWVKILRSEVERQFNQSEVDGFEDSAPSIKLAILSDMYDAEPMNTEIGKELAYDILATEYSTMSAWN